jgi:curved DNA-binding protein CbpA
MEIGALAGLLDRMNYYQILKVAPQALPKEIKMAFLSQSREFHPDRYFNVGDEELRTNVTTVFKRIAEAYQVLRNPKHRAAYDKQIAEAEPRLRFDFKEQKPPSGAVEATAKNPQAKKFLQMALNCLKKKDYSGAEMNFQFALKFEPNNDTIKKKMEEARAEKEKASASKDPYKIA